VSTEPLRCAGAVIVDNDGRIFVQRRSAGRRLYPNTWDIVGGHIEPGETAEEALRREVYEETGWSLSHILTTLAQHSYRGDDGVDRVEIDFLVRVDGDLARPRLEKGKHTEFRWLAERDLDLLDENGDADDWVIRGIVEQGFAALRLIFGPAGGPAGT
jgi:8-oxo-dGTP diphosphatase